MCDLSLTFDFIHIIIEKVAKLARLSLKPEEKEKLGQDLNKILEYVQSLSSVN